MHFGIDARLRWDRHFVVTPMLAAGLVLDAYVYLSPELRDLICSLHSRPALSDLLRKSLPEPPVDWMRWYFQDLTGYRPLRPPQPLPGFYWPDPPATAPE